MAIEPLECRALLSGVAMSDAGCAEMGSADAMVPAVTAALSVRPSASRAAPSSSSTFVYTESNNPAGNAVLAYRRNDADGSLTPLRAGGRGVFSTGGRGFRGGAGNSRFGPDDTDGEVVASSDGRLLFAVNQGSDTVSEFAIRPNGRLKLLRKFASGGKQPVSLQFDRMHLYVLNRGNSAEGKPATVDANLTTFDVSDDGRVSPRAGAVALPAGISPSQILVSPSDDLLFVDNFATPSQASAPSQNTLQAYQIQSDGALVASPAGPVAPTGGGLLQGLARHPTSKVIYGGVPSGAVAVFSYDSTGMLTAGETVGAGGGTCWAVVSDDGQYLYVTNTGANTVGVYSLADPLRPARLQDFALRRPKQSGSNSATGAFQLSLDLSGRSLYVVNHGLNERFQPDNHLHALVVADDGTVSEPDPPRVFSSTRVTAQSHPQGLAVVIR